ncbi:PLDc N-terminal domain-containing protein [Microbacterium sp. RD1]|uniref:PLDc N-terminal domain-containing protein n=1 Tax=Microbacterium sp. RD1 TaxID=3457313 RepID=UPI003FA563DD
MTEIKTALSPRARTGLGLLGLVQVVFAFLAYWDLWLRNSREVRGPKPVWIPVILVNWLGPLAYFAFGIRHTR